jgi:hypothetical protein
MGNREIPYYPNETTRGAQDEDMRLAVQNLRAINVLVSAGVSRLARDDVKDRLTAIVI